MIFVSFGTALVGFDRLAKAIDEYALSCEEPVLVQYGNTKYPFQNVESFDFIENEELQKYLAKASVVVLQGGWGAILEAIEKNCRIVAVPRIKGKEVNHDQSEIVKKLEAMNVLLGVYDINDLPSKIEQARIMKFASIERGSAFNIINRKLEEWFNY